MRKRRRRSREEWIGLIRDQAEGEESVSAFCRSRGVSASSFYRHKHLAGGAVAGFREIALPRQRPVRVVVCGGTPHIEVEPGFDGRLLREVVEALR